MSTCVRADEPMSRHLAARVGGPVDRWVVAHEEAALIEAIEGLRRDGVSWAVLGAGTRTLVRDGGVAGGLIRLGTGFSTWSIAGAGMTVGAGAPAAAVAAAAAAAGLAGLEELAAVPGSFGAVVALDEGPWRAAITQVRFLPSRGKPRWGTAEEARAARIVLEVQLTLTPEAPAAVQARTIAALRGAAASWWAPPRRATARKVIERAGLVDVRVRDVWLPRAAPELVVNLGRATARDVQLVLQAATERISRETGLDLAPRVRWVGRAA